ncbi:MAG: histidine kinase dimerization/phospho-acceptor domain-containing protein [bacterium]
MKQQPVNSIPTDQQDEFHLHPLSLKYQGKLSPLENGFRIQERVINVFQTRIIVLIAILLFSSFGFYDVTYDISALENRLLFIRFIVTVPVMVAFLFLIGTNLYRRYQHLFQILIMAFMSASLTWTSLTVRNYVDHTNFAAVIIFYMGAILIFRPRLIPGTAIGVVMFAIFIAGDLLFGLYEPIIRLKVYMFMLSGFLIGTGACYMLEYVERERYYLMGKLAEEQRHEIDIQRLETIRTIARTVAHEFNNPLGAILGAYDFAVRPKLDRMNEKARNVVSRIPANVRRMEALVKRLLSITRVSHREYAAGLPMLDLDASEESMSSQVESREEASRSR